MQNRVNHIDSKIKGLRQQPNFKPHSCSYYLFCIKDKENKPSVIFKSKDKKSRKWFYVAHGNYKLVYSLDETGRNQIEFLYDPDKTVEIKIDRLYNKRYMVTSDGIIVDRFTRTLVDLYSVPAKYVYVKNRSNKMLAVHRLVAHAFCPRSRFLEHIPYKNLLVNHIDGIKDNNHYTNLEWVTAAQNNQAAYNNGLNSRKGENHNRVKHTDEEIKKIRTDFYKSGKKLSEFCLDVNLTKLGLSYILKNVHRYDPNYFPDFEYIEYKGDQKGEDHPGAKLTQADVQWIRNDYINNHNKRGFYAEKFGVSQVLIKKIVRNKAWYDPAYNPDAYPESNNSDNSRVYGIGCVELKVNKDIVKQMRREYVEEQRPYSYYANQYNISKDNVKLILRNKTWYDPDYIVPEGRQQQKIITMDDANWIREHKRDNPKVPQSFYAEKFLIPQGLVSLIISNKAYKNNNWHIYYNT